MATSTPTSARSNQNVSAITGYNGPSKTMLVESFQQLIEDEIA